MSELNVTVAVDGGVQMLNYELAPSTPLSLLRSFIAAETDKSESAITIRRDGRVLSDPDQTIAQAGIRSGDMLAASTSPTAPQAPSQPPPNTSQPSSVNDEIEQLRQQIISNPSSRQMFVSQNPQLEQTLNDPVRFREAVDQIQRQRRQQAAQQQAQVQALNDDVNEENQAQIMERIRLENIEREMDEAMQSHPEFYGRVTMLYIQVYVNGHPVKAFVDSGAQSTIMSPSCAEACNVTRLIDTRWSGVARGVGTAKILGRIHRANVSIGDDEVPCAFTVMEGKDVDMLFGLDMLKRYQACIDLSKNCLTFPGGTSVPFLPESEIPKSFEDPTSESASQPTAGPAGPSAGNAAAAGGGTPASATVTAPPATNFRGQGQSLGAGTRRAQPQAARSTTATASQPSRPAAPAAAASSFPQKDIDILMQMGATREQAIQALQATGGNVDYAASLVLDNL